MERTRHFVATVYVVHEGATALHHHPTLDMWLPPGGHIDRGETPHEAAIREVREELGVAVDLNAEPGDIESATARSLPRAEHLLIEDIDVCDGEVGHQHVDHVYYGSIPSRDLDPGPDEVPADDWEWFDPSDLREADLAADVAELGREAIATVGRSDR
ncbi:NUDIX hydrolase [Halococcoides cellulosivorans]|uniref:NUDIX hydrolase n=1 Tax=Halococcoides cellulosivorans TaxID=1679096 RepID=A0A2R4X0D5_9EURY|nr:NUDIX domain-containing protein [Halococcoides cellulosivorans]AWB27260.1 NUDIX hydrolase [Halococcoides cellulosivorans]